MGNPKNSAATPAVAASPVKNSSSGGLISPMTVGLLVVAFAVLIQVATIPSLTGPAHPNKPFSSFPQFYPFYRSEHSNEVNRKLHFAGTSIVILLFLINLRSLPAILFSACVGYVLCPMLVGLSHGFVEFGLVVTLFIIVHKLSTGKIGVAALIPIVGYGFAWFGHFFHEHNRPATFIYPTYSLMGDFYMFYRIASGQESF